jgi:hypothetical protein
MVPTGSLSLSPLFASHTDLFSSSHHHVDHHAHWVDFGFFFVLFGGGVFEIDLGWMSRDPPFFLPPSFSEWGGGGWVESNKTSFFLSFWNCVQILWA